MLDGNVEELDWDLSVWLIVRKSEHAAGFPWPEGVVEDIELDDLSHTRCNLKDLLRFTCANRTSFLPTMLALEVYPLGTEALHLLLELLRALLRPLAPLPKLGLELLHHVMVRWTSWARTFTEATSSTSSCRGTMATSSTSKTFHQLSNELHGVVLSRFVVLL